jgi:hypothetical protein
MKHVFDNSTPFSLKYCHFYTHTYYIFINMLASSVLTFTAIPPYWDFTDWVMYVSTNSTTSEMEIKYNKWKNNRQSLYVLTLSGFSMLFLQFLCICVIYGRGRHFVNWVFECTVLNTNFQESGFESRESAYFKCYL